MNKSYQNFKKKAGKFAIALTLVGTTVAGGMAIGAESADAATVKSGYTTTSVNLRKSASTKSARLATIKKGKKITILKTSGSWLKVKYDGKTGYVYKTYVNKQFTTKDYSGKFTLKTNLNVRKGPGTSFVKAGTLKKGTVVTVKGKTSNGWYTITYKGATRYISASSKYLTKYVAPAKNNAPTISVDNTYTLTVGDEFKYSDLGATATDKEDGSLTSKIEYSGVVNSGKVGTYTVKLTVTDSNGATTTKSVKVIVNEPTENTAPVIAVDSEIYITQGDKYDTSLLGAKAFDNEEGNLTSKIVYSGDVVDTSKVGNYNVKLSVTDNKGVTTTKTVKVIVTRNVAPTISTSLENKTLKVTKGTKFDYSMLKVTANDKEDGNLTDKVVYSGDKVDINTIGEYTVVATVTDTKGETAKLTIKVNVVANQSPVITFENKEKTNTMVIEEGDSFNKQILLDTLQPKATDPEDGDLTAKIDVYGLADVKANVPNKAGEKYQVRLSVEDEIGGTTGSSLVYAYVEVKANNAPNIDVNDYTVKQGETFSYSDLKATASDYNDATKKTTDVSSSLKYDGYVNTNVPGKYTVTVTAKDEKGLESKETITVTVAKYSEPTMTISGKDIVNNTLTVKANGQTIDESVFGAVAKDYKGDVLKITYSGLENVNTNRTGEYKVVLSAMDELGHSVKETITIYVVE